MNAFTIVIVLVAALALLALIFSFIAVRGKNGPWGLFSALFSLGAGVLFAIWLGKTNSSLLGNFTQEEGILGTVADFAFTAVMTGLAHFALCSVIGGFIRPLMKNGKPNNPVWRLLLYVLCMVLGITLVGYFLYISATHLVRGGGSAGDVVMIATGIAYLLSGIIGIGQWKGRNRRIARAKEREAGKPTA